jgi:hypothetical protein
MNRETIPPPTPTHSQTKKQVGWYWEVGAESSGITAGKGRGIEQRSERVERGKSASRKEDL